jgi:Tol biopolymer transport system component
MMRLRFLSISLLLLAGSTFPQVASAAQFRPVLADTAKDTDPAPSPDGKWLLFQSNRGGPSQIWVMPIGGGAPRRLTSEPESSLGTGGKRFPTRVMTPTWAPDSKSILFVSTRSGPYNIYSLPIEGGKPTPLSSAPGSQRFPVYSPDGKKICFPSSRLQPNSIYGFNLYLMSEGGEIAGPPARQVTFSAGSPGHPIWSPDGKWIAYVSKDFDSTRMVDIGHGMMAKQSAIFAQFHVFKIPATGGKEVRLTGSLTANGEDTWPSWSPDGKWIAFGRNFNGAQNLWVVNVLTKKSFAITSMGNCMKPTWSADGKSLYFTRLNGRDEDIWVATDLNLDSPSRAPSAHGRTGSASSKTR